MEHNHSDHHSDSQPTKQVITVQKKGLAAFLPLVIILATVLGASVFISMRTPQEGWMDAMRIFMGVFFLVFGAFKAVNLKGFAQAYAEYDILAKRSRAYALLYPFFELAIGVAYLVSFSLLWTSAFTTLLMGVSAIGVARELLNKNAIPCACLGVVFKIPMTKVTLAEDVVMGLMALIMLLTGLAL